MDQTLTLDICLSANPWGMGHLGITHQIQGRTTHETRAHTATLVMQAACEGANGDRPHRLPVLVLRTSDLISCIVVPCHSCRSSVNDCCDCFSIHTCLFLANLPCLNAPCLTIQLHIIAVMLQTLLRELTQLPSCLLLHTSSLYLNICSAQPNNGPLQRLRMPTPAAGKSRVLHRRVLAGDCILAADRRTMPLTEEQRERHPPLQTQQHGTNDHAPL